MKKTARQHEIKRETKETKIKLAFSIDGSGKAVVNTGIGFFDHMLDLFATHGLFDLSLDVKGDLNVDGHHTVEDVGICLGQAFREAIGDCRGIQRFANVLLPMDESLCECAIDISGRSYLGFQSDLKNERVGDFDAELVEEFLTAFVSNARLNLHIDIRKGSNMFWSHKVIA